MERKETEKNSPWFYHFLIDYAFNNLERPDISSPIDWAYRQHSIGVINHIKRVMNFQKIAKYVESEPLSK